MQIKESTNNKEEDPPQKKTNEDYFESFSYTEIGLKNLTIKEQKFINNYMKDNRTKNERQESYKDKTSTKSTAFIKRFN